MILHSNFRFVNKDLEGLEEKNIASDFAKDDIISGLWFTLR